jgi:hypothetical protein
MLPFAQEHINPYEIPMFPNLTIAQLLKVLKWQIENNDASSIQLFSIQINKELKIGGIFQFIVDRLRKKHHLDVDV